MKLYVLKNKEGKFVHESTLTSKALLYVDCPEILAQQYDQNHIRILEDRFKGTWREQEIKPFLVNVTLTPATKEDLKEIFG